MKNNDNGGCRCTVAFQRGMGTRAFAVFGTWGLQYFSALQSLVSSIVKTIGPRIIRRQYLGFEQRNKMSTYA
jgi:hypothetical protein